MTANNAMESIEIFGVPLFYEDGGTGTPLVLIHEGIADHRMFDPQVNALREHHRVIRYDLFGYGRSGKPQIPYTHYEALAKLLDHLGIARTALLGMSMGGGIAVDFTLTYPDRVDALILAAAGLDGAEEDPETMALVQPVIDAFEAKDFPRAIEAEIRLWVDGPKRTPEEVDPAVRQKMLDLNTEALKRTLELGVEATPLDPLAIDRLSDITAPTLVIVGDGDVPTIVHQADLLARNIPGAQKLVFPGVAHVPNLERPQEFNQAVLAFLA